MNDKEKILISKLRSDSIGDDGAVIGSSIYSADAFCEDIHFRRAWMTPAQIGRKAMLVNLSDAVAMNAIPRYALVTLSLPQDFTEKAIAQLVNALEETAAEWGCEIIGGDTVGGDKLNLSITLISHSDTPLLRTGVEPGDWLAYTGTLGTSRLDLNRLESGKSIPEDSRFLVPTLRADFIRKARPYLRAGMDISDGLFCDTNTLLNANNGGVKLSQPLDPDMGLSGEEYEMLVAIAPSHRSAVEAIAHAQDLRLTFFGTVTSHSERLECRSHHFG
jgi:thiamine-monophosphate kinase